MKQHPCPKWDGCSAGYCPMTQQGSYNPHDDLCGKLSGRFIKDAAKDLKGANPAEAIRIITKVFDRQNLKQAA